MDYLSPIPFHMASFVWCTLEWFYLDLCVCACLCTHICAYFFLNKNMLCVDFHSHFLFCLLCDCVCSITQSCLTLCDPVDCSHQLLCPWNFPNRNTGVGFAIFSSRGSSQPKDQTCISCIGRKILYHWTSWDAPDARIEICIICCGNNDKTGSSFSWGDLAKVWGESWHFHWVWRDKY